MAKLKCKKWNREMDYEEAECPKPEDYCDNRTRCAVWFLTEEKKKQKKEGENAAV